MPQWFLRIPEFAELIIIDPKLFSEHEQFYFVISVGQKTKVPSQSNRTSLAI